MGNNNNARGRPQDRQGGNQRGHGVRGNAQPGKEVACQDDKAQFYSFMGKNEAEAPIHVSTPIRESVIVTHVYHACPILFMGFQTWANLVIFYIIDFDIILGLT